MIAVKENIVAALENDTTLQTLLGGIATDKHIYPSAANKFETFPCLTYLEVGSSFRTVPAHAEDITLEFHIFSRTSVKNTEDIYSRLNDLLNYYYTAANPLIRWCKQIMSMDVEETDRQLFHKVVRYQIWAINS